MKLRTPTLDLLAREFAQAVSEGDLERAEGWLAVAHAVAAREVGRRPERHGTEHRPPRLHAAG